MKFYGIFKFLKVMWNFTTVYEIFDITRLQMENEKRFCNRNFHRWFFSIVVDIHFSIIFPICSYWNSIDISIHLIRSSTHPSFPDCSSVYIKLRFRTENTIYFFNFFCFNVLKHIFSCRTYLGKIGYSEVFAIENVR